MALRPLRRQLDHLVEEPMTNKIMSVYSTNGTLIAGTAIDSFCEIRSKLAELLLDQQVQPSGSWQSVRTDDRLHDTYELRNVTVWYQMPDTRDEARMMIRPDLPWAEAHFAERVSGEPMNPGVEHANWPYHGASAALHLRGEGATQTYDHNYMERFWPKNAGDPAARALGKMRGIRFPYGDLDDVVAQLKKDDTTRQAYLPVFFPEDTGATKGQRVPCSLGYHFMIRGGKMYVQYVLRSCEVYRHFTNDVYLAVRLAQWVRSQVDLQVSMGQLTMQIASFHGFVGDTSNIEDLIV